MNQTFYALLVRWYINRKIAKYDAWNIKNVALNPSIYEEKINDIYFILVPENLDSIEIE